MYENCWLYLISLRYVRTAIIDQKRTLMRFGTVVMLIKWSPLIAIHFYLYLSLSIYMSKELGCSYLVYSTIYRTNNAAY